MTRTRARLSARDAVRAVALLTGIVSLSCSHETGPSLSIEVESQTLAASSPEAEAASVCCCHVRGTLRNTSSITIHANLNFDATGASGSLGTALDWVTNVAPGAQASYEAVGIAAACTEVTGITGRHFLTGVYTGSGGP